MQCHIKCHSDEDIVGKGKKTKTRDLFLGATVEATTHFQFTFPVNVVLECGCCRHVMI